MRKIELTDAQLSKVIELGHGSRASWSRIERELKIPRQAVKRAYENWERSQSKEELTEACTRVAAEEFRQHVTDLVEVAECLVGHLSLPSHTEARQSEQSLHEHSRDDVPWGALGQWASAWDDCVAILGWLGRKATEMITDILKQKDGLLDKIGQSEMGQYPVQRMVDSVVKAIWQAALVDFQLMLKHRVL